MIFGEFLLEEGLILAHDIRLGDEVLKKGKKLDLQDIETLRRINYESVMAAKLAPTDIEENPAANILAQKLAGNGLIIEAPLNGRVNLRANKPGLLDFAPQMVKDFNLGNEEVLLATLPPYSRVYPQDIVATIKVIPFALPHIRLEAIKTGPLEVKEFKNLKVVLLQSFLPNTKKEVLDKSARVQAQRLADLGSFLAKEIRCMHETKSIAVAIEEIMALNPDLILFLGAAAASDRRDILPQAITQKGGEIEFFGLPVDPGNLLFGGKFKDIPFIGVPGCGRSPKLNGFDWVLQRILAGLPLKAEEVAMMGVGGILAEIWERPAPRERKNRLQKFAAIILAAGCSRRMGQNKLLLEYKGKPMLSHALAAAKGAGLAEVIIVVGNEADRVKSALGNGEYKIIECPDYHLGMSFSLKAGIAALPQDIVGFFIMLGDMPEVSSQHLRQMVDTFHEHSIVVPHFNYKRGNPVLWSRDFIPDMQRISGDQGARNIIAANPERIISVEFSDPGVIIDYDTPESLIKGKGDEL